jgi:hypothetical protein
MTSNRWDAWEPQAPPEDFAQRTVAIALQEAVQEVPAHGRVGRARWVIVAAAATMLVGGAAWGFSSWSVIRAVPMSPTAAPTAPEPLRAMGPLLSRSFAPAAPVDAGTRAPVAAPSTVARPRKPQRVAPESSAPDAGRKVIVPACDCVPDQVMCSCF